MRTLGNAQLRVYLASTGFSGVAFGAQYLLASWLLIGVLGLPGDQVGVAQAAIGIPGIFVLLWGGASADSGDPRRLLLKVYSLAPLLPLALILIHRLGSLSVWTVTLWALGMNIVTSFSSPAQQAILNRVAGPAIQQAVTTTTAIGFLVQVIGLSLAGQLDRVGLDTLLMVQAVCLVSSAAMIRLVTAQASSSPARHEPAWQNIIQGLRATYAHKVIFNTLVINFSSSIFNASAMMLVFPFIVKRLYEGDAALLSVMMSVFFGSALVSNLLLLRFTPIARPGRLYLGLQLSRIVIVFLVWLQPPWWALVGVTVLWGLNMGLSSTISRTIVQESVAGQYRGRVLSVFNLGQLGSLPLGALILGWVIETFGTINALVPAMIASLILFTYGVLLTPLWRYRSPEPGASSEAAPPP